MRCSLAVDLPDSFAAGVATIQDRLSDADGLRFTDSESAHVTLKFLNEVSPDRVEAVEDMIKSAVKAAGVGPFGASVGELGVSPSLGYIRIVWVGVDDGATELTRLHEAIEREATALGFNSGDHEFTPHVTLTRMDDTHGKVLVQHVIGGESPTIELFRMRKVHLKKSDPGPDDSGYETVAWVLL